MRLTKLRHRLWAALAVSVSALLAIGPPSVYACALDDAQAYQASSQEVSLAMEQTALSQLGDGYPTFPQLEMGYPDATSLVSAPAPCLLLKAIGYTEGMWEQAWGSVPVGASGPTKQSASCGYGIMQITSGMRNPNELPLETQLRIAGDYRFNIAWGTNILAEKWNTGDLLDAVVGDRDPSVAEHWYYAVWAYNQFNFKNNPNNPDYPWPRPEYDGSQSRLDYPYQEIVWGYAAHPPELDDLPLWEGRAPHAPRPCGHWDDAGTHCCAIRDAFSRLPHAVHQPQCRKRTGADGKRAHQSGGYALQRHGTGASSVAC